MPGDLLVFDLLFVTRILDFFLLVIFRSIGQYWMQKLKVCASTRVRLSAWNVDEELM